MDRKLNIQRIFVYKNMNCKELEKFERSISHLSDAQIAKLAERYKEYYYSSMHRDTPDWNPDDEHNWSEIFDNRDEDFVDLVKEEDEIEGF